MKTFIALLVLVSASIQFAHANGTCPGGGTVDLNRSNVGVAPAADGTCGDGTVLDAATNTCVPAGESSIDG